METSGSSDTSMTFTSLHGVLFPKAWIFFNAAVCILSLAVYYLPMLVMQIPDLLEAEPHKAF